MYTCHLYNKRQYVCLFVPYSRPNSWADRDETCQLFIDYLNTNESVHTHNTRNKNNMHLPRANTGYGLKCLKYKIPKLPLKEQSSLYTFKKELKMYLITKLYNDN